MAKKWFRHGKWARWMVVLHYYSMVSFLLLLVSGIALFWPPIHTVLIPYLPIIYYGHIVLGLIFAVTLLTPFVVRWPLQKLIRRFDWLFPLMFGTFIVITGFLVWKLNWFPTTWRSVAFHWHGYVSYLLAFWLLIHAVYKALSFRPDDYGINAKVDPERRMFLKWFGAGVVGAAVITVLDPVGWFRGAFQAGIGTSGAGAAGSRFAAFYTVTGGFPKADLSNYHLKIDGLVANPTTLGWNDVLAMTSATETADFHCVTGWSVASVKWEGLRIQSIVQQVKPHPTAKYVHFYSFDGAYTESLSLSEALDETVLLAHHMDGEPLLQRQGYPLRLVVPKMYGYKSIKWVNRVEFSDKPLTGYWEKRGYPNEAYLGKGI